MEDFRNALIFQQGLKPRRARLPGSDLHQMRLAIASRKLNQTKPIAMRSQPHRFGIDSNHRTKIQALRQITFVEMDFFLRHRIPCQAY